MFLFPLNFIFFIFLLLFHPYYTLFKQEEEKRYGFLKVQLDQCTTNIDLRIQKKLY